MPTAVSVFKRISLISIFGVRQQPLPAAKQQIKPTFPFSCKVERKQTLQNHSLIFTKGNTMRNLLATLCIAILTVTGCADETGKPGLLILAHGSPSKDRNAAVQRLAEQVQTLNETAKTFHAVAAANLELAAPDTAAGIETLEKAGCDRIVVVPVFICPSSHTHFDVPAALGLYSSPSSREAIKEGHFRSAKPKIPLTMTQTISESDLLDKYVQNEVTALSTSPKEEAVLLIAHGDEKHAGLIEPVMRRLLAKACGSKGITQGDWTFCQVGQSYNQNVVPAIQKLSTDNKRVLVIGLYLVLSAKTIHDNNTPKPEPHGHAGHNHGHSHEHSHQKHSHDAHSANSNVLFSERGIIDYADTPKWVLQSATDAL
jgi:hypothetical protein